MVKHVVLILILLAAPIISRAQNKTSHLSSGRVVYGANITMDDPAKSKDTLRFNRTKSIFQWQRQNHMRNEMKKILKEHPNAKVEKSNLEGDKIGRFNVYNTRKDSMFSRRSLLDQIYLLKEQTPHIYWNITDRTKKIGNYICKMASTRFRGRTYTAWFTPQIPVPYGPWKLVELPGLILQAYDKQNEIRFNAQEVSLTNDDSIESILLNGHEKTINLAQYKKLLIDFRKKEIKNAHKFARKLRQNHPNAKIQFKIPQFNPIERFNKGEH